MSGDGHVHGPECGVVEVISAEAPLLMVLVMPPDEHGNSKILVRGSARPEAVPVLLRALADDQERRHRARLS